MPGMKIALLGATGFVGRAAARALADRPDVQELILVDYDIRAAKRMAKALSPRCRWAMADVGRSPDLARLLGSLDAVASAVGPCAEYEKAILLTCAGMNTPAASIGDGPLAPDDRREIHDAFRRAGVAAVSGCGLMPGFTELLAAHSQRFPPSRSEPAEALAKEGRSAGPQRFLCFSPARFGGYAFFRRISAERLRPADPGTGLPDGVYFATEGGDLLGLPPGRPAALFSRLAIVLSPLGEVGRALSSAFRFWLRGWMTAGRPSPAAAAGILAPGGDPERIVLVEDAEGRLPGRLLAECAVALARSRGQAKGLLPLAEVISPEDGKRIAAEGGGRIVSE